MSALLYFLPVAWVGAIILSYRVTRWRLLLAAGLAAKLAFAFIMTFMLINLYNFGDLPTYFTLAKKLADGANLDMTLLYSGSYLVALLNSSIFRLFPPSIYGLATLAGVSSFIYAFLLIKAFVHWLPRPAILKPVALIMFLPVLSAQSGYIGKEMYVLPLLGMIFYLISVNQDLTFVALLLMVLVGFIRPYQAIILIFSAVTSLFLTTSKKNIVAISALSLALLLLSEIIFGAYFYDQLRLIFELGVTEYLAKTFPGGSLMLEPYIQPFTIFQNFRPFFWEAHNALAVINSAENSVVLFLFFTILRALISRADHPQMVRRSIFNSYFLTFLLMYTLANLIVFSYDSNMGDLARRHIYYYPQIILLAFFVRLKPKVEELQSKSIARSDVCP